MPWSDHILEQFETVDQFTTDENEYYGPFNTLLAELFPSSEYYQVVPLPNRFDPTDSTIIYLIRKRKCPVFFVQMNPLSDLDKIYRRAKADQQMRDRFYSIIGPQFLIPKLYGISAMGTRFSVYEYNKETNVLSPPSIPHDLTSVTDVAPATRWNYDLFDDAGEQKMRELVAEVKVICQAINI